MKLLEDWQVRVCSEREELLGRISDLKEFCTLKRIAGHPNDALLRKQLQAMNTYEQALKERIESW